MNSNMNPCPMQAEHGKWSLFADIILEEWKVMIIIIIITNRIPSNPSNLLVIVVVGVLRRRRLSPKVGDYPYLGPQPSTNFTWPFLPLPFSLSLSSIYSVHFLRFESTIIIYFDNNDNIIDINPLATIYFQAEINIFWVASKSAHMPTKSERQAPI